MINYKADGEIFSLIATIPLFKGVEESELERLLENNYKSLVFQNGELIASQGERYRNLLIITKGKVIGRMVNWDGEHIVIEEIEAPRSIAPAILFATENTLPVDVIAMEKSEIISISMTNFTKILSKNSTILINMLRSISDRGKFLSERVRMLRFGTIKQKVAEYIFENIVKHGTDEFLISHTQQELADMFGVTRPALSRVLRELNNKKIVKIERRFFKVLNKDSLMRQ